MTFGRLLVGLCALGLSAETALALAEPHPWRRRLTNALTCAVLAGGAWWLATAL